MAWYDIGMAGVLEGSMDLDNAGVTHRFMLMLDTYVFSDAHDDVADVVAQEQSTGERLTFASKAILTATAGEAAFDAADDTFSAIPAQGGNDMDSVISYRFVTADSDSPLLCQSTFTPALTGNGSDISVTWATAGIARIT